MCVEKKPTPPSSRSPTAEPRSRRSRATPVIAGAWCAKCFTAKDRTFFERAKVRWTPTFRGSTFNGRRAFAMAVNYGGV
jgi:hypothetical protein